jgi:hypothetical protein
MIPSSRVFDLSSFEPMNSAHHHHHHHHHDAQDRASSKKQPLDSEDSLPSFDCSTDDSESSTSSYSTIGSTNASGTSICTPRRSMFHKYWKNTGQDPMVLQRTPETNTIFELEEELHHHDHHHLPQQQEEEDPAPTVVRVSSTSSIDSSSSSSQRRRRRSILPPPPTITKPCNRSISVPSFGSPLLQQERRCEQLLCRKSVSSGDLKPSGSCLRESRYSGKKKAVTVAAAAAAPQSGGGPATTPVRFDMEAIDVVHFELPQERYAEQGWSSFFA